MIHNIISDIVTEVGGTKLEIRTTLETRNVTMIGTEIVGETKIVTAAGRAVAGRIRWVWLKTMLLSGSPLVRAFTVIEKFMSNIFPFPLSLDRIRDTRITIMTGRGGVVTGRRLPMREKKDGPRGK